MKNFISLTLFCASVLILSVFVQETKCNPQLTFSSDWSGGKRELEGSKETNFVSNKPNEKSAENFEKRAPGWGKRAPGWGKRNFLNEAKIDEIIVKIREYEEKATELRNFLFEMIDMQKNN